MRILAILLAILAFLSYPSSVRAEFTFSTDQTTISYDQELDVSVTLSLQGQDNKTYYLEGAFKNAKSSSYFGLTWNDSSWIKYTASSYTTLKTITTDQAGKWNGTIKVKIDNESNLFLGSGTYTLRMKRFTSAGSGSWADNSVSLIVNSPAPTPTPNPTPTPQPTSVPTPTPTPSSSSSPAKSKTTTPSKTPAPSLNSTSPQPSAQSIQATSFPKASLAKVERQIASIAGITSSASPSSTISVKSQKQTNYFLWAGAILIFAGSCSIGYIYLKKNADTHLKLRKRY